MKVFVLIVAANLLQSYQVVSSKELCKLPSETGPCKASFPRWFYNVETEKCSQFVYGGCDGNKNNFKTREKCENKCHREIPAKYPCFAALQEALGPAILVHGEPKLIQKNSYLPSCDTDGYFSPKQCDTSKGECWCVNKMGKEILNSRKQGKNLNCDHVCNLPVNVGPCFAAFSRWFFNKTSERCEQFIYGGCEGNANNFEKKKDCKDNCVSRKRRVKRAVTKCQEELLDATESELVGRFIPRCSSDGSYSLVQCHASTGYCWCSDGDGTKFPGTDVPPGKKINCDKYKEKATEGRKVVVYSRGTEDKTEGRKLVVYSRGTEDKAEGRNVVVYSRGTDVPLGKKINYVKRREKTVMSKCQKEALKATKSQLIGSFVPQCTEDGTYKLIQCHGSTGYCWCSDRDGTKFPGTDVPPGKEVNCDKYKNKTALTKCQQEVLKATKSQLIGSFVPQCNDDGTYRLIQCHGSTGYCWCSDRDGVKFPGTDIPPGKKINCDKYKEKATERRELVVDSNYQVMQRQKDQGSSSGDGSKTALIVVSVCAALCVMATMGILLVRRRRKNTAIYGKLQESNFVTGDEKQPLFGA